MTLHLTRDEAAALEADGRVVLFRAGDFCDPDVCTDNHNRRHPPAEFVEAAKPCETCGGRDGGIIRHPSPEHPYHEFCPDCFDGKRRIAAVMPCEACDGRGFNMIQLSPISQEVGWCSNPDCTTGLVTVATVVVEWGPWPVVDRIGSVTTNEAIVLGANSVWRVKQLGDDLDEQLLTLPPDVDPQSLVGQYALGIRKVET